MYFTNIILKLKILILSLLIKSSISYFESHDGNELIIDSTVLLNIKNDSEFPFNFDYSFKNKHEERIELKFIQVDHLSDEPEHGIKVIVNDQQDLNTLTNRNQYKLYRDINNHAIATLIKNEDLKYSFIDHEHKYRIIINGFDKKNGEEYFLRPVVMYNGRYRKSLKHAIVKRSFENEIKMFNDANNKIKDFVYIDKKYNHVVHQSKFLNGDMKFRERRALNGQPVKFFIELGIVTDFSVFNKHSQIVKSTNVTIVSQYMKIFYSHLINAVNQRYLISLSNDPDLRISVVLKFILIETSPLLSNWSNPCVVGDLKNSLKINKTLIMVDSALNQLSIYLNKLNITFDHAVGITTVDLYLSNGNQIYGFATTAGICTKSYRFSIISDRGFNSISILAHELGHSLGSDHDKGSCLESSNYLMTPLMGKYDNLQNVWYFSKCSIASFKSLLLLNKTTITSRGQCLTNSPINLPIENSYFNYSLPGQLWNVEDQCKMIMNFNKSGAAICGLFPNEMCSLLYCLGANNMCYATKGWGAIDGTPCDKNKVCFRGSCVNNTMIVSASLSTNVCSTKPCLNKGVCVSISNLYECICPIGYTGQRCETTVTII